MVVFNCVQVERDKMLSDDNFVTWTRDYHLYERLRFNGPSRTALASIQVTQPVVDLASSWLMRWSKGSASDLQRVCGGCL